MAAAVTTPWKGTPQRSGKDGGESMSTSVSEGVRSGGMIAHVSSGPSLQECVLMVDDIIAVFKSDDDTDAVDRVRQMMEQMKVESEEQQDMLRNLQMKLQESNQRSEEDIASMNNQQMHKEKVANLEKRKSEIIGDIMNLEEECERRDVELQMLRRESQEKRRVLEELESNLASEIPRQESIAALYAAITGLRLHKRSYEGCAASGYIAGVCPPSLKLFSYSEIGTFEQVNDLWKLIEQP
eukprot:Plantae.Rhodophyta-Purpureofilum_apyrenoidigerum.ctg2826.p1 GENE.Plantae.Rhodophyta-Purpureofilum_apyrenoidigerum.ctg2826~~Plantae.Rhodophyta-Purpureofilum_apyrenoidigerum.ctg2826.p1  ORF type:complete len:240 (-),score=59.82 Plantae.Rhodophyta-Purpureofilum_apyrenoidigerum.ctg2826:259-978(-)